MTERAEIWLGIHDASRLEWVAEIPLPQRGAEEIELELCAEVPVHIWSQHDHWERLQMLARLSSPNDEAPGRAGTVDELRRATLAAVHRFKDARDRIEHEIFLAASLLASAPRPLFGEEICQGVGEALAELERERAQLVRPVDDELEILARERILAAEFLSNHAIEFISKVQRAVDEELCGPRSRQRSTHAAIAAGLRPFLATTLARELTYREAHGFVRPDDGDPWLLEHYVARASLLKKHFQEMLFLQLETERSNKRFRNVFGIAAASLAALWALPLGFLLTESDGSTGLGLGLGTTLALLIFSYAVKDRIKETVRAWLSSRVESNYAGRLATLTAPARLLGAPVRMARVRESFFTSSEFRPDPLHPDLGQLRPVVQLRYLFRGVIEGDPRLAWHGHERMKLVFRYDLSPLFTRLDDPIKQVPVLAADGMALRFAEAARCYRLPVQLRLRHRGVVQEQGGVLVTHKLGLERIERQVLPAGNDALPEGHGPVASIPWATLRRR